MKTATRTLILLSIFCLLNALPVLAQQEIPEAAKGRFKAGLALIEKADKPADFLSAMSEFEAAADLAPQWADIHYNLARLAAETDKPAKAIKEYRTYLTLTPAASDRAVVEGEMAKMKALMASKRKIGLPGVKFAAMPDGIWILQVFPGAKIGITGLQRGDRIVAVDGKSVVGHKLDEFFKVIESSTFHMENVRSAQMKATSQRLYSRVSHKDKTPGPVVALGVKRANLDKVIPVLCKKEMFRSNIIEIEEDEFEAEVVKEGLPVVVTLWASWCGPCREFTPIIEAESAKHAGKVKFVNINVDENKKLAKQLAVKGIPTLMVFKDGNAVSSNTGRLSKDRVAEILNSAVDR
jgi:thioredoxin 1